MAVFADDEGLTLILGDTGDGVTHLRVETTPTGAALLVYLQGIDEPVRANLSPRDAAKLALILRVANR